MINLKYTVPVISAHTIISHAEKTGKRDTSYLGRFTFKTLLDFEGIGRIFTTIARGYLFHDRDGSLLDGDAYARADYAYRALCAWCSIPEKKNATPKAEWQSQSDFREYHEEFPELGIMKADYEFFRHKLFLTNDETEAIFSLLILADNERTNLQKIIEGIRYGENPSEIEKLIII